MFQMFFLIVLLFASLFFSEKFLTFVLILALSDFSTHSMNVLYNNSNSMGFPESDCVFYCFGASFPYVCMYFVFLYIYVYVMEKAIAPYSSPLAWRIPWMEEPGRLQSMGSLRVRHDWTTSLSLSLFTFMHWRRNWQPTPVILTGESQGRGSLVGCRLWRRTESDTTEAT